MNNWMAPTNPAEAFDTFLPRALERSAAQREWTEADGPLPALYLSHGAPPLFDDAEWIDELFEWGQRLPKPKAILAVSAHWEAAPIMISGSAARTNLVYDFGGFHPRYYQMLYPTPDSSALAAQVAALMPDDEPLHQAPDRGLDHGAWVPLKIMYPMADVPVLQLSMPTNNPAKLLEIGQRLQELRSEGVLIVGSGFMTHGLQFLTREMMFGDVPAWSSDFDAWAREALDSGDVETLLNFRAEAPGMPYAHPTVEHFIPLFVTLGASRNPEAGVETTIDGYRVGFSKRSFQAA
jgi:4,5-DOPA dioxygenase extradiol